MKLTEKQIEARYNEIKEILLAKGLIQKDYKGNLPKLQIVYGNKNYFGQISRWGKMTGNFTTFPSIQIAIDNMSMEVISNSKYKDQYNKEIDVLTETICHEFAHMKFWSHGPSHTKMTNKFLEAVGQQAKKVVEIVTTLTSADVNYIISKKWFNLLSGITEEADLLEVIKVNKIRINEKNLAKVKLYIATRKQLIEAN